MSVASGYAAWLQAPARYQTATVSGAAAAWGAKARTSEILSPFAFQANGAQEAARQAQLLAGPFAIDTMLVAGRLANLAGYAVTLQGDRLDYEGGADVFVLTADETEVAGATRLTVLKRL